MCDIMSFVLFYMNYGLSYTHYYLGLVGSMPLQLLEVGFHVEIHAIEWHDFQRETQIHGVVVA